MHLQRYLNACGIVGALLGTSLPHTAEAVDPAPQPPNIILAMADDMGWGDVAYNGHPVIRTPNLDAMARDALRFNRFYAPTVCSPTRASCLTGRHPFRYGIVNANVGRLPASEWTLAEALHARGYRTGHFGKWHVGTLTNDIQDGRRGGRDPLAFAPPWAHGFDVCFSTEQAVPTFDPAVNQPFKTKFWTGPGEFATDNLKGEDSRVVMDRAVAFIRDSVAKKKPFLSLVWFHAPHEPVKAGEAHRNLYADRRGKEQNYYGCITALDEQMGRLRSELKQLGVVDNTIVWFVSDNGPEGQANQAPGSTGPLRGRKRDLWEGGIRVPGILEFPAAIKSARVIETPCVTSDFLPTILDYAGVPLEGPAPLDGISLRPLIEGKEVGRADAIGFEYAKMAAWIDNDYKLVALLDVSSEDAGTGKKNAKPRQGKISAQSGATIAPVSQYLLFNIVDDPGEAHDLAAEQPDRVKSMAAELAAWRSGCRTSLAESQPASPN